MNLADDIWRLIRDILIALCGVFLVVMIGLGKIESSYVPPLVPLILGLFAAPKWLRDDERKREKQSDRDAKIDEALDKLRSGGE